MRIPIALVALLLASSPAKAKVPDDGIWRWDSAGCAIEIQDVIRGPNGKRLSDQSTQRLFAKVATGSDYLAEGTRYVPFMVRGDGLCVLRFAVTYCERTVKSELPTAQSGPFGLACGQAGKYTSGVRVLLTDGRPLTDATAVVAVTSSRGEIALRRKGGPR